MALRGLHSQLVAQVCAQRKHALQIKGHARNDPEFAKISGEVQEFCVCGGSKRSKLKGLCACKGSKCCHVQCMQGLKRSKFCACKGSKIL